MKNPAFLFISLAGTFEGFSTSGMATFLPKLIQNQFGTSAAWAAILSGKTRISLARPFPLRLYLWFRKWPNSYDWFNLFTIIHTFIDNNEE